MKASELINECLAEYKETTNNFMCNILENYAAKKWVKTEHAVNEIQIAIDNEYTLHGFLKKNDPKYKAFNECDIPFESKVLHLIRISFFENLVEELKKQDK